MPTSGRPQHLFAAMLERVQAACAAVLGPKADLARVLVEPPRDPTHGDMATNAAMVLAKEAGKKPRELAEAVAEKLRSEPNIEKADVAGPGFINLTLKTHVWGEELRSALAQGHDYGRSDIGRARRSMSNMFRPIRPARYMSAMAAVQCSATRSPICSPLPVTT